MAMEGYLAQSGLDPTIKHLVKIRASQINGCAYCIDMHTKDARAEGETEQRIYALDAWRETPFFTDKERAALAWTETVTHISGGVSEEAFDADPRALRREGTRRPDLGHRLDQRLEPHRDQLPVRPRRLQAAQREEDARLSQLIVRPTAR